MLLSISLPAGASSLGDICLFISLSLIPELHWLPSSF